MPDNADDIIDLTELIESGPNPGAKAAQKTPPPGSGGDIDVLLAQMEAQDELSLSAQGPAKASPAVDPHEELDMSGMGEVDDLLGSLDIPLEPRKAGTASSSPVEEELDSAVDKLLNDLPPPDLGPSPAPAAAGADSAADEPDALLSQSVKSGSQKAAEPESEAFDAELDSLLGDLDKLEEPAPAKKAQALKSPDRSASLEDLPGVAAKGSASPEMPGKNDLPADLDEMLAELDPREGSSAGSAPRPGVNRQPAASGTGGQTFAGAEAGAARALAAEDALNADLLRQSGERLDELARLNENLVRRLDDMSQLNASMAQRLDSMSQMTDTLGQRLAQCESELARARAKIDEMEKAETASLEDLLCEGNSLHDRFAALIARSVSEAFRNAPTQTDPAVIERMDNFALMSKTISARMDAMENRLDLLEPRFNHEVEKAAAMAVVKILREEIARLGQGAG